MKNVIILNNRSLYLYDFRKLKEDYDLRLSAVIFHNVFQTLSSDIKKSLDNLIVLPDVKSYYKFLESFPESALDSLIHQEKKLFPDTWIVAADELNNLAASHLREKYHIPGTLNSTILKFRDKIIQKEILKKHDIRIPMFTSINRAAVEEDLSTSYDHLTQMLGKYFILKPADMFGTIGVEKIETLEQFKNYIYKFSNFSRFLAEEFIQGHLYHCDFIIYNREYVFIEVSQYLFSGLAFLNGSNHGSLLLKGDNPLRSHIIDFCKGVNSVLGLESGCGHFEVFVTPEQELVFLEAAARPAGSSVPITLTKTFHKNYMNAALLAEIHQHPGDFAIPQEYYFWASFPNKMGTVKALNLPPLKSTYEIQWNVQKGCFIDRPSLSLVEKSGSLLAHHQDYETIQSDFNVIKNFKALDVE